MFTEKERLDLPINFVDPWEQSIKHVLECCKNDIPAINSAENGALALKTVLRMNKDMQNSNL